MAFDGIASPPDEGTTTNGRLPQRVITAALAFTGNAGEWIDQAAVALDGANIAWVGTQTDLPDRYRQWEREDHPESTLLPGFVETHAHLGTEWQRHPKPGTIDPSIIEESWNTLHSLHTALRLADQGVTTVQSLGSLYYSDVALREAVHLGLIHAPRIVAAGAIITPTGGHGWRNGSEADSISDILHAVREHHKAGVDTIKFAGTGGFLSPGSAQWKPQFTIDQLRAGTEEAHRLGKTVAVHAHGTAGIEQAVEVGADLIAHASFVSDDGITRFVPELAERIAHAHIYVDVAAVPSFPLHEHENWFARAVDLYRHGVKVVAGHDIGIDGLPPETYLPALELLHEVGLPIEEVLVSATSRAAKAIGLAGITGVLAAGYEADVIVVDGNPLTDISAIRRLSKVVLHGKDHPLPSAEQREEDQRNFGFPDIYENGTLRSYQERRQRLAAAEYV